MYTCIKELMTFIGFASYYRRLCLSLQISLRTCKSLNDLLTGHSTNRESSKKFTVRRSWCEVQQQSFGNLVPKLTSSPFFFCLCKSQNVPNVGIGLCVVLNQVPEGLEKVIAYANRGLRWDEVSCTQVGSRNDISLQMWFLFKKKQQIVV